MRRPELHAALVESSMHESRVRITGAIGEHDLWITSDGELARDMTAWLAILLPIAMSAGCRLAIHGSVDSLALQNAAKAQSILASWYGARGLRLRRRLDYRGVPVRPLTPVDVTADDVMDAEDGAGTARVSLFSGGVDAFYAALHNESASLLFVHGADIPLSNDKLLREISAELSAAAAAMGRPLVQARTNVRELSDQWLDWGSQYHGAALAGVAVSHAPMWAHATIASGAAPDRRLTPWGSDPRLDSLWTTSGVAVSQDTLQSRAKKLTELSEWPVAMNHLRVCNTKKAYNCGRCEKCVRTMIALHVEGRLGQCGTLPHDLTPSLVRRVWITGAKKRGSAWENLAALLRACEWTLAVALLRAIGKGYFLEVHRVTPAFVKRAFRRRRLLDDGVG